MNDVFEVREAFVQFIRDFANTATDVNHHTVRRKRLPVQASGIYRWRETVCAIFHCGREAMEAPDVVRPLIPPPDRPHIPREIPWRVDVLRSILDIGADICSTLKGFIRPTKMNI